MLKRSLAAGLLACAALTPVAFAQADKPSGKIQFIEKIDAQKFRGTDFMGQTVYNNQDEAIGDIGDALLDQSGQISAVIIDVGGFLGIGAREVAVPFNALRLEPIKDQTASTTTGDSGRSAAETEAAAKSQGGPPPGGASGGQTGSMSNPAGSTNTGSGSAAQNAAQGQSTGSQSGSREQSQAEAGSTLNKRIVLNATREELQNAPEFKDPTQQDQGASGNAGSGASGSSAPAK